MAAPSQPWPANGRPWLRLTVTTPGTAQNHLGGRGTVCAIVQVQILPEKIGIHSNKRYIPIDTHFVTVSDR